MRLILIAIVFLTLTLSGHTQSREKLIKELDDVYVTDQAIRKEVGRSYKEYGMDSPETKELFKQMREIDSINIIRVAFILDSIGWQGKKVFGDRGNQAIFLVIQHSDLVTQEKYLPLVREATKKGRVQKSSLALLEDRVALGQGKKQIYGSQILRNEKTDQFYVAPIEDPENVDKRRKKMGLRSMEDYLKTWDITWNVQEHKDMVSRLKTVNQY